MAKPDYNHQKREELRALAKRQGYTGTECPTCGSYRMIRTGCETCCECGTTTSCG